MTVSSATSKAGPFNGNDSTDEFPFNFRILDETHIRVFLTDADGIEQDDLVLGNGSSNYSVSFGSTSGTVTYPASGGTPLPTGWKLTILRNVPITQETDIANAGAFYPETHEEVFDKLTMAIQQVAEEAARSVKVGASDTDTEPEELIAELIQARDDAVAAAAAAATSETNAETAETNAEAAQAAAEAAQAAAEAAQAAAETAETNAETAETNAETAETNAETAASTATTQAGIATTQAGIATTQAGIATDAKNDAETAADSAEADAVATAADRVQTGIDRAAAELAATQAANTLASALWRGMERLTSADSPYTVTATDNGKLLVCDTTSGAITITLAEISTLTLPFTIGVQLDAGTNGVTINRGGTDTIDGGTSISIGAASSGYQLLADDSGSPDEWEVLPFGMTGGNWTKFEDTGDGSEDEFDLGVEPGSANNVLWFEGGVIQKPGTDFTVSGTTLTRTTPPANGVEIFALIGSATAIGVPGDGTVTNTKLDSSVISGQTSATILAADSIMFGDASDSNNLKKSTVQGILDLVPSASIPFRTTSSTTTIIASDKGGVVELTGSTNRTWDATAVATLGAGFSCLIHNNSTAILTFDPNSSEQVDGLTTRVIYPGELIRLNVNAAGTAFETQVLQGFRAVFDASGSFTVPAGYTGFQVEIWSGGGAGGCRTTTGNTAGGGGGGYYIATVSASALVAAGSTETVTVGGTAAGVTGNNAGTTGNDSTFTINGVSLTVKGGGGGATAASSGSANSSPSGYLNLSGMVGNFPAGLYGGGGSTTNSYSYYYGGEGGGCTTGNAPFAAGNSIHGGGGGGASSSTAGGTRTGGSSVLGGAGGVGGATAGGAPGNGTAPGGGGGGSNNNTTSGSGAPGRIIVRGII